jgi:mannan endo-1,4-beta-mannosidase
MKNNSFITVNGRQFALNGKPYYIIGTNLWYGCYLGATEPGRERLRQELDLLQSLGINNLRLLGAAEHSPLCGAIKPGIQKSPGVYDESLLQGLDFLIAEMKNRKMYAVIYLTNYWEWSGGMAQYVAWQNQNPLVEPDKVPSYRDFMRYSASFYSDKEANKDYQQFIRDLLHRKNVYTGQVYKDDPVIMAWELANEPRPHPDGNQDPEKLDVFYKWIDQSAGYIKSLDSKHLVTTGSEGTKGCLENEECFVNAHSSKYIDYITIHLWPRNWGWWKPERMEETLAYSEQEAVKYIDQQLRLTEHLSKPMVLEEFGFDRDNGSCDPSSPVTARNRFYQTVFNRVEQIVASEGSLVGTNFWTWGGFGRTPRPDFIWQNGDPFIGDPIPEPQGRNSVFDIDTNTLEIIKEHANHLIKLNKFNG